MARGAALALPVVLTAAGMPLASPQGLVCEACQSLAAAALRHLSAGPPDAADGLAAGLASELADGDAGPPELAAVAALTGLPRERLAERYRRFLPSDRPVLRRLSEMAASAPPAWKDVQDVLCVRRLRCHPDGLWAEPPELGASDAAPVADVADTAPGRRPGPRAEGRGIPPWRRAGTGDAIATGSDSGAAEGAAGASGAPAATTYERMLHGYGAVAGAWEPPTPRPPPVSPKAAAAAARRSAAADWRESEERFGRGPGGGPKPGRGRWRGEGEEPRRWRGEGEEPPFPRPPPLSPRGARGSPERGAMDWREGGRRGAGAMDWREPDARPGGGGPGGGPWRGRGPWRGEVEERRQEREEGREAEPEDPLKPRCPERQDSYKDLAAVRVVAVLFCGRRDRLRILLRYLGRDLRRNGGIVDHVILALWQVTPRDSEFLEQFVAQEGNKGIFEIRDFSEQKWGRAQEGADPQTNRMVRLYQSLNEPDTVYVKIDDDVVYVAPHAIASVVRELLRGRCLLASANVVNHAIMSPVHQERGAHRGFLPREDQPPERRLPWRKRTEINMSPKFQFDRHPAASCVVERWDCAALVHESFLDRAADGTLCAFDFGWLDFNRAGFREHRYIHRSPSINKEYWTEGARWSTNFFAFTQASLEGVNWQAIYGKGDDEEEFTGPHAQRREGHSCAVGRALAVHFSYGSQEEGLMAHTDLLRRYDRLSRKLVPSLGEEGRRGRGRRFEL